MAPRYSVRFCATAYCCMRRFDQYAANLCSLEKAYEQDLSNPFIIFGIVEQFAVQFELGWKLLREMAANDGIAEAASGSPRTIIKCAYAAFSFLDGHLWLDMLNDRNSVLHLYSEATAREVADRILAEYIPAFRELAEEAQKLIAENAETAMFPRQK